MGLGGRREGQAEEQESKLLRKTSVGHCTALK